MGVFRARLARLFAVVLLLWTGLDLVNTNLCAADQRTLVSVGATTQVSAPDGTSSPSPAATEADCFCCVQTVQLSTVSMVGPLLIAVEGADVLPRHIPVHMTLPLDHPPQTL